MRSLKDRLCRRRLAGGFTLVELLIAFVLVALISLLLFSGLRLGLRSWGGVEAAAEIHAELRLVRDFLRRILDQAYPITLILDAEQYLVFAGDGQHLEFVAPLSAQVGIPGLYLLQLGLEETGMGASLILRRWLLNPDVLAGNHEIPAWQPVGTGGNWPRVNEDRDVAAGAFGVSMLMEGIEEFEISYFGFPAGEDPAVGVGAEGEWQASWQGRATLPQALRIHLTKAGRVWPDLIVVLGAKEPSTLAGMGTVIPR